MHNVGGLLNDFGGAIADFSDRTGKLTTARAKVMHERSRAFLRETLATPHDGPTVVVTHHAPHRGSLHPRYVGSPANPGFVSDLEGLILTGKPELWVHGHVHDSYDYRVGRTRVVCNPKGYGNENLGFDPCLVVEV
jgi:Icc-related predicted phosphoesterase